MDEDGVTELRIGSLVVDRGEPVDPPAYAAPFAGSVEGLLAEPELAGAIAHTGRERAIAEPGWTAIAWTAIARETRAIYVPIGRA
jgi:hypothetical protein